MDLGNHGSLNGDASGLGFQSYNGRGSEQQDHHNPRANSFGGGLSVAASEDDRNNASLYINNNKVNQAPSEADSDTIRKMTATNLKREFEQY